jgi:hypothetical protein
MNHDAAPKQLTFRAVALAIVLAPTSVCSQA